MMEINHLCNKNFVTTEEIMKELILGRNEQADVFTCRGCSKTFQTICVLHYHCMTHTYGGSYFFDHVTKSAFPKLDSVCSYTQVTEDLIKYDFSRETTDEDKVLVAVARDINQQPFDDETEIRTENTDINYTTINTENSGNDIVTDTEPNTHDINADKAQQLLDINAVIARNDINTDPTKHVLEMIFTEATKNYLPVNTEASRNDIEANDDNEYSAIDPSHVRTANMNEDSVKEPDDESESENVMVTVKNIKKTDDGLFSFEMDEKDAYLFDKTAESIMDRIRSEGEEWIRSDVEFQIKVVLKEGVTEDVHSSLENNDRLGINAVEEIARLTQSQADIDPDIEGRINDTGEYKKEQIIDTIEDKKGETLPKKRRGRPAKKKLDDELPGTTQRSGTLDAKLELEEYVESEPEESTSSRRSGRKRKVSSRLKDVEWETPGKLKQKRPNSLIKKEETNQNQEKGRDDKQKRSETENLCVEVKKEKSLASTKSNDLPTVASGKETDMIVVPEDKLIKSEVDKNCEQSTAVSAGNTFSADLSASEVLLSLSKGNKEAMDDFDVDSDHKAKNRKQKKNLKTAPKCKKKWKSSGGNNCADSQQESNELPPSKRKDYTCPTCGKVGNLAMIKYHEQCHSTEKPFTCEVCGKGFKTRPCLVAHVRQHGERQFRCDRCPAAFFRKQYLTSHLLTHTGELPYICKTCNKGFRELYILHRHTNNVHKNIRNFPCDLCSQTFFRQETLDNHRVRHFAPTLKCHYCTKMFKVELDRRKHELIHTGEKLFFCPICSNGFSQLWPYYRHMWKKHNIGKEEAKEIKIKNKNFVAMRNINVKLSEEIPEQSDGEELHAIKFNVNENEDNRIVPVDNLEPVNIIYKNKDNPDGIDVDISQFKDGQIIIQGEEEFVTQSSDAMVVQSGEDLVVQSTSDVTDLKGIYDHLYVTDATNVANAIHVLTGNQTIGDGTVIMETHEEHPDTGNVSIVQQNIVILSDYTGMEGSYSEMDGYTKEYSTLDI